MVDSASDTQENQRWTVVDGQVLLAKSCFLEGPDKSAKRSPVLTGTGLLIGP